MLQSELESCNQLQELEPLNKCESIEQVFVLFFLRTSALPQRSAVRGVFAGCLLTIILLMRALDPLGYEKETLAHFQTLKVCHSSASSSAIRGACRLIQSLCLLFQEVDSMRSAYYSDLCSKFMIENTILKMEYAEVRVFSISDKVGPG